MAWRYRYNGQPVADGERTVLLDTGKVYVRTGLLGTALTDPANQTVTYRLREIYDDAVAPPPMNNPPIAGSTSETLEITQ